MKIFMRNLTILILIITAWNDGLKAISKTNHFTIEPYLLEVSKNSAIVAFHLNNSMDARVLVFDNNKILTFKSDQSSKSHFIKISNLKPGRTYNYQVICGNNAIKTPRGDTSFQIRTANQKGESFSFVVYGDPRPGETMTYKHHREVIEKVIQKEPAFTLVLGDMVDNGTKIKLWENFFSIEKKLLRKAPIFPVIGDNDFIEGKGLVKKLFPNIKKGFYHFEWGDVQFFAMNAWDTRGFQSKKNLNAESEQIKWLESQLSKEEVQKSLYRVVFLHDPVRICRGFSSEILQRVWEPIFTKYNVDVVFASWHLYERSQYNGIVYIISGGAGAELLWMNKNENYQSQAEAKKYHFMKIDISAGAMTINAIDVNDTIIDSFTISPKSSTKNNSTDLKEMAEKVSQDITIEGEKNWPSLTIHLFSSGCSYCNKLLENILPKVSRQNQVSLKVHNYNLELHENVYDLLLAAGADFGNQNSEIPSIFIGRKVFGGKEEIENNLEKELTIFKQNPEAYIKNSIIPFENSRDTKSIKEENFNQLSFESILHEGLIDSVNPCTFLTLIFFSLFLIVTFYSSQKYFLSSLTFILSMFITYLIIGLIFYDIALGISEVNMIPIVTKWILVLFITILAIINMSDSVNSIRSTLENSNPNLKNFIIRIRGKIRSISNIKTIILPVAIILGSVFALTELICIGKIYIQIANMISEPIYRAKAVGYLFTYNFSYMLPIIVIYLVTLFGTKMRKTK